MKFLPIPGDIRHWGGLSPPTYHTVEPNAGSVLPWSSVALFRVPWGWCVVEAKMSFHHMPHTYL